MDKLALGIALLFGLVNISLPLHAQGPSVALNVCNAGKTDVDMVLSQGGKVSTSHAGPADCVTAAKTQGAMEPAYIGFAFADAKGQWGGTHRIDLLPNFGSLQDGTAVMQALLGRPRTPSEPPNES